MTSGILGEWIGEAKKYMHFSTKTQNMGRDNNSPTENVHYMTSGALGQWIGELREEMHCTFQHKHIVLKTWDKTTTHQLRMCIIRMTSGALGQWIGEGKKCIALFNTETYSKHGN